MSGCTPKPDWHSGGFCWNGCGFHSDLTALCVIGWLLTWKICREVFSFTGCSLTSIEKENSSMTWLDNVNGSVKKERGRTEWSGEYDTAEFLPLHPQQPFSFPAVIWDCHYLISDVYMRIHRTYITVTGDLPCCKPSVLRLGAALRHTG